MSTNREMVTAPNKPGDDVKHNKCNEILLTVITGLFLVRGFVGGFDQNPAFLRKTFCYLICCVTCLLLQDSSTLC